MAFERREEEKPRPVENLREGNLEASLWRNQSEEGRSHYGVTFTRAYKDQEGKYQRTNSFGERDLLKLSHLAERCHDAVELRRQFDREEKLSKGPEAAEKDRGRDTERSNERRRGR